MFSALDLTLFSNVTLKDVWSTVGVELVIFAVTVVFAVAIRLTSSKQIIVKKSVPKIAESKVPNRPACALPKQRSGVECAAADLSPVARQPSQKGVRNQGSNVAKARQPWELVDGIMTIMREHPGQRSAGQALQMYSELRASLGFLEDKDTNFMSSSLCDIMRRSKHSAIDLYTTLVQCAVRSGQCYLVESLLADMVQLGVTRPFAFYESTMKQLAGQKQYRLALHVFDQLSADGLEPSAVTCSCLISFAAELGEIDRAVGFFEKLSTLTTPSIRAYMTVLRALAKQQDWTRSLAIFRNLRESNVKIDSLVLNIVLATGVAADKLSEVKELLIEADSMSPPITDVVSYNTLIKGYAQRSEAAEALQTVSLMQRRGLQPNAITFNTVMDSVVRGKDCDQASEVLKHMRDCGIKPDKFTCSIFIKGISKQPTPAKVRIALDLLETSGDSCDATLLASLYNAIVAAAASIPDNVLMMQTVSKMRQRNISLSESSAKRLRERSGASAEPH